MEIKRGASHPGGVAPNQHHNAGEIVDDDGDTGWRAEQNPDEDILRARTAGSEVITIHKTGDILRLLSNAADQGLSIKQFVSGFGDPYTATFRVNDDPDNAELNISLIGAGTGPSAIRFLLDGSKVFAFSGNLSLNVAALSFGSSTDGFVFLDDLPSPTARLFEITVAGDVILRQTNPNTGDNYIESAAWRPFDDATQDFGTASKRWKDGYFSGTIRSASAPTSIQVAGSINIGADAAAADDTSLDLTHTDRALLLNRLTTTQRNALTPISGHWLYNTTLGKFQAYENGAWITFGSETVLQDADGDTKVQVEESADEDIIRFDATGVEIMTIGHDGAVDIFHVAAAQGEHGLELIVDAAGKGNVHALDIVLTTGAIAAGADEEATLVNIDESAATGGSVAALRVLSTEGSATVHALEVGVVIGPVHQLSGTFGNMDVALVKAVDRLTEFTTSDPGGANNIVFFVADNDTITIGDAAQFFEIEFLLATLSSKDVKPTFEYSKAAGAWEPFFPADGTNGMQNTGVVAWEPDDVASPAWVVHSGNYRIRITRTKGGSITSPIEDKVQIAAGVEYEWDKNGDLLTRLNYQREQSAAGGDTAGLGQVWVKDDAPNTLYYTDDTGVDHPLSKSAIRYPTLRLVPADTDVAVGAIGGDFRVQVAGTLLQDDSDKTKLMAYTDTAGVTGTMVVDIHLNGTTIMDTDKLDIATGDKSTTDNSGANQPGLTTTAIAKDDILTFIVDAKHTTAAKGLTVAFAIRET